jgi:acyl-CoA reductase-like NAD-dependent aldehyde dehydrogenase
VSATRKTFDLWRQLSPVRRRRVLEALKRLQRRETFAPALNGETRGRVAEDLDAVIAVLQTLAPTVVETKTI